jgi:hypothetical protein
MRNSLIIAVILCVIYSIFLEFCSRPVKAIMQSQRQDNQYAIEKYLRDSRVGITQHQVVYVGSSLTKRLDFDEESKCIYNLSLSGDSALTGLRVVANSNFSPRLLFVEINVPERSSNQDLIKSASGFLSQLSSVFYIENMPINLVVSFLSQLKKPEKEVIESVRLNALAMQVQQYKVPLSADTLKKNMDEFNRLVKHAELKGIKVVFFEMPVHPDLEYSPRALQIRKAFKSTFPNQKFLQFYEIAKDVNIKTIDGLHLSMDEAKFVVENMKMYSYDVCENDVRQKL